MIDSAGHFAPAPRALWLLGSDQPKADTLALARWVRAAAPGAVALTVGFLAPPTGEPGPVGEFGPAGSRLTIPDALRQAGVNVVHWPRPGLGWSTGIARLVEDFIRDSGIGVVHSVYLRADRVAAWLRKRNRPLRWLVRPAGIGRFRRTRLYGGDWYDRLLYRRADMFIANSHAAAEDWSARLRRPIGDFRVVHNAVPASPRPTVPRAEARARLGIGPSERLALTVARLDREKGIDRLIDAAALVARQRPELRWVVLGDGPLRARLARRGHRRFLADRFALAGRTDDVWSHLAAADLFVLPSRMESCPNALLEAMSAGRAVVATAVGGVTELLSHERDGLLVDAASDASAARGLANAIGRLLDDPALADRLAEAARARAGEQFAPATIAAQHRQLYERLHA